jgi:hypothetical protein
LADEQLYLESLLISFQVLTAPENVNRLTFFFDLLKINQKQVPSRAWDCWRGYFLQNIYCHKFISVQHIKVGNEYIKEIFPSVSSVSDHHFSLPRSGRSIFMYGIIFNNSVHKNFYKSPIF